MRCRHCIRPAAWRSCWSTTAAPTIPARSARTSCGRACIPLTYVEHARNFGEHNAVMTGLRHASGAYVITMDDDLQNPPEEVIRLYDHARLGNWDVVYTRYGVKQHAGWRNLGSRLRQRGGGSSARQAEGPLSVVVPLHVGVRRAGGDALPRTVPVCRWADHAGDPADRQHRGSDTCRASREGPTTIWRAWCDCG